MGHMLAPFVHLRNSQLAFCPFCFLSKLNLTRCEDCKVTFFFWNQRRRETYLHTNLQRRNSTAQKRWVYLRCAGCNRPWVNLWRISWHLFGRQNRPHVCVASLPSLNLKWHAHVPIFSLFFVGAGCSNHQIVSMFLWFFFFAQRTYGSFNNSKNLGQLTDKCVGNCNF